MRRQKKSSREQNWKSSQWYTPNEGTKCFIHSTDTEGLGFDALLLLLNIISYQSEIGLIGLHWMYKMPHN